MSTPTSTTFRSLSFDEIEVGDEIPTFEMALTVQRMVMDCGVNRDFAPIHHDREIAQSLGAPDMFVNTLFLQGVYEAAVREWVGLDARVVAIRFRMHTFNCAGDMLLCSGKVVEKNLDDDGRSLVTLDVQTDTPRAGTTTSGQVVISL
jgi:acyl dehydratase